MSASEELATGTVLHWNAEEGWGVLVTPALDGQVFAHYSMIRDQQGFRSLAAGQRVWFTWAEGGQDGCSHRAIDVYGAEERTTVPPPVPEGSSAYTSSLVIEFEDGTRAVTEG